MIYYSTQVCEQCFVSFCNLRTFLSMYPVIEHTFKIVLRGGARWKFIDPQFNTLLEECKKSNMFLPPMIVMRVQILWMVRPMGRVIEWRPEPVTGVLLHNVVSVIQMTDHCSNCNPRRYIFYIMLTILWPRKEVLINQVYFYWAEQPASKKHKLFNPFSRILALTR